MSSEQNVEPLFTSEQYSKFRRAVLDSESRLQVPRIRGRMKLRSMVEELGRDVCDAMFAKLNKEEPKP